MNVAGLVRAPRYFAGLDLGKSQDFSAIVVIERKDIVLQDRNPWSMEFLKHTALTIRHIQRIPLQTPYPDIVEFVRRLLATPDMARQTALAVDATGVGAPVVDLLRRAKLPCELSPVTITSGSNESQDAFSYHVPKRDLITGLQVAFQKRWLRISRRTAHCEVFTKELLAMRLKTSPETGHDRYHSSEHDDLVMAAALAWWKLRRSWPHF